MMKRMRYHIYIYQSPDLNVKPNACVLSL